MTKTEALWEPLDSMASIGLWRGGPETIIIYHGMAVNFTSWGQAVNELKKLGWKEAYNLDTHKNIAL